MIKRSWNYILTHKWAKDILRANMLFVVLVVLYNLLHFQLKPINFHFFNKTFWLMNLCLVIKMFLNAYDKADKQQDQ